MEHQKPGRPDPDSPFGSLMFRVIGRAHIFLYRLTGGRIGGRMFGAPVLLLTVAGRKTGKLRTTPLMYLADGDNLVVVASKGGSDRHPIWWLNLMHAREALVEVGRRKLRVSAEPAGPEDRSRLWPRVTAMYSDYAAYQRRTDREIPLGILRPIR
jgi:F420H(2)-dependent quinone reductase